MTILNDRQSQISAVLMLAAMLLASAICIGCAKRDAFVLDDHKWKAVGYQFGVSRDKFPRQLDPEAISVSVKDAAGQPVNGCQVTATLSMPSMPMPKNTVTLKESQSGAYDGVGRYTMSGDWLMQIDVRRDGQLLTTHTVQVTVH